MAKGIEKNALAASGTATKQAGDAYDTVNPIYKQMAEGNMGYTPQQKADELTASSGALGGGVSAVVGQGGLQAARTGNAGGDVAALDDAARQASVQQSANAVGVQNDSNQLAEKNRIVGVGGLNSIYSDANSTGTGYLNTANQASANTQNAWMAPLNAAIGATGVVAGKKFPCWIAAELYGGWYEPRTIVIRHWLLTEFSETPEGRLVVKVYAHFGRSIARIIRTNKPLRWFFQRIFDQVLTRAVK